MMMDIKSPLTGHCSDKKSESKEPSNPKPKLVGQAITKAPFTYFNVLNVSIESSKVSNTKKEFLY